MTLLQKILFAVSVITGVVHHAQASENALMQSFSRNIQAPSTEFSDGKKSVALSAFRGKFVLVNFWATWCPSCIKEMPTFERLATRLERQGLVVVAISQDAGGPTQVRPFLERLKLSRIKILYDNEKRASRDYALRGLPTTFLISPEGMLLARLEGSAAWDTGELAAQVENFMMTSVR